MFEDHTREILDGLGADMNRLVKLQAEITVSQRRAAEEWEALRLALGLDEHATAQGVVTELAHLRAQVAALNILDGEPVAHETTRICGYCLTARAEPGGWECADCRKVLDEMNGETFG